MTTINVDYYIKEEKQLPFVKIYSSFNYTLLNTILNSFFIEFIEGTDEQKNNIINELNATLYNTKCIEEFIKTFSINIELDGKLYAFPQFNDYIKIISSDDNKYILLGKPQSINSNDNVITTVFNNLNDSSDIINRDIKFQKEFEAISNLNLRYYNTIEKDSSSLRLPYKPFKSLPSEMHDYRLNIIHMGQRKLLMSEIEFLTMYVQPDKQYTVIYAGAAPGTHITILIQLFPNVKFELYDTNKFSSLLYNNSNVRIYKSYFLPNIATKYANNKNILFISDIRTNNKDEGIINDNNLNLELIKVINPDASMLKFRLPYKQGTTILPQGSLYTQCWNNVESSECRLICNKPYTMHAYNHTEHEEKMYYHNTIRPCLFRQNIPSILPLLEKLIKDNNKNIYYDVYRESYIINTFSILNKWTLPSIYKIINNSLGVDFSYYINNMSKNNDD